MSERDAPLSGVLAEIAEATSLAVALRLADAFGGTEIYVPRRLRDGHPLAAAVGAAAARTLVERYGGSHVMVPLGPSASRARRRRAIAELIEEGRSASEIARALRCHVKTVRRHRRRLGLSPAAGDGRQLDLLERT